MTNKMRNRLKQSALAALVVASASAFVFVGGTTLSSQAHGLTPHVVEDGLLFDSGLLNAFYQDRSMRTVWVRGASDFQPRLEGVVKILEDSWTHGLNPEQYHVTRIRELIVDRAGAKTAELDMLVSDAVIRYGRDLTGMRDKNYVHYHQVGYWRQPVAADKLIDDVFKAADPVASLRKLEPTGHLYTALRHELVRLSSEDDDGGKSIAISKSIKPGQSHPAIPLIRERLAVDGSGEVYDDGLASHIMTLQRGYDMDDNGVITKELAALLSKTREERILQISANMERLRWLDQERPERYVLVNIPSASLWAVDKGKVELEMPVIVGKEARPTYSFKTEISGVRFNPNWTVPPTIQKDDFLPMLMQDPHSLTKRGIIIKYQGKEVDPAKVDWTKVNRKNIMNVKMVQAPGDDNPLGKVRVIMDNPYNIYLHDTNNRTVFDKKARALSSGCVRVAQPEKLAEFILRDNAKWDEGSLRRNIDSGKMRDVATDVKIPVFITYQTIWLDENGRLVYGQDLYGQDKKLGDMLKKSGSIHIPNHSKDSKISL